MRKKIKKFILKWLITIKQHQQHSTAVQQERHTFHTFVHVYQLHWIHIDKKRKEKETPTDQAIPSGGKSKLSIPDIPLSSSTHNILSSVIYLIHVSFLLDKLWTWKRWKPGLETGGRYHATLFSKQTWRQILNLKKKKKNIVHVAKSSRTAKRQQNQKPACTLVHD